jgi:FAD/FMN-containing dehydrogenase
MSRERLLSWGNHPPHPQTPISCHWQSGVAERLSQARTVHGTTLPFGSGLSYGDSCLAVSDHVLDMRSLNRLISADWTTGIVAAEAGVTLEEILDVAILRGWFLSVTPGTKYITLGGAIANDVHGKNHHRRGTFGVHLRQFGLQRSDTGRLTCSASQEPELFAATIGGLGLTGIIEWAEIQLTPIRSSEVDALTVRFGNLDEFFALSSELDERHEFCVSWIDCAARGRGAGRGIYMAGDFAKDGVLAVGTARKLTLPVTPPFSLVNGLSLRAFNEMYWHKAPRGRVRARVGYDAFFYPLDAILEWNRIYGPKGFQQYQCLVPEAEARPAIGALLEAIAASGAGSFLAVLKRCGDVRSPGLLSFPRPGTTLALDFPQSRLLDEDLFPRLDAIVREAGGRLYPAKDAHMRADDFQRSYPEWTGLESIRDPALMSRFWERVTR